MLLVQGRGCSGIRTSRIPRMEVFDTRRSMEARTMGDYPLYDMENKEFGTDIRGLEIIL